MPTFKIAFFSPEDGVKSLESADEVYDIPNLLFVIEDHRDMLLNRSSERRCFVDGVKVTWQGFLDAMRFVQYDAYLVTTEAGYPAESLEMKGLVATGILAVGEIYTVVRTDVHDDSTDIYLEGMNNKFNSSFFKGLQ